MLDLHAGVRTNRWHVTAFVNNFLDNKYLAEVIRKFIPSILKLGKIRHIFEV